MAQPSASLADETAGFDVRPFTADGLPRTLWWDASATDEKGRVVARMRHLLRFIKASSPLYQ